jgi:hypothetical protein
MTIASYSDLTAAAANWLARSDLTSRIPEGIVLCEAKMNRYLKTRSMVTKDATFSITGEYVAVPSNFGGVKSFYLNTNPTSALDFMADELMTEMYLGQSGQPEAYNVQGSNFRFGPVPDATYTATLVYYLYVPALTVSNTTNWLISSHPDAYLYGVLAEMATLLKDAEAAQSYFTLFYKAMDEIDAQSKRETWAKGATMATRLG